ncbi:hypothetical protein FHX80_114346 [Streptomyces brevispora]|uniref:CDP-alcohol phosphatidyltransferase-like enzyme n=1 Tax=Streptomyces brevispora TaxID=887462 RepID=A0A561V2M0_9ACTN|nr:hypothetical protein [Streptomyces brevispora]TWG05864.1 hypothetical protein FHX80_114346 [Streptomyces brevispora]
MRRTTVAPLNGLYALKPWYANRPSGVRASLVRHEVSPDTLTAAGVIAAAGAAAALALLPADPAALPVAALLAARLAFANLDGALARETGRTTRRGLWRGVFSLTGGAERRGRVPGAAGRRRDGRSAFDGR